jgi:hypothetical protein
MQRDSGTTATNSASYAMSLETSESLKYAGQTVTLSFYARAGANFSGSGASSMRIYLAYGTGTDQNVVSGFTGVVYLVNGTVTAITTSWVRYSFTVAVPSTATQLGLELNALWSGTAGAADFFEITGVQLELGSVATPFARAGGSIGGELALCQRYYYRQGGDSLYPFFALGIASGTTQSTHAIVFPVTMRAVASSVDYSTLGVQQNGGAGVTAVTSVSINTNYTSRNSCTLYSNVAAGLVATTTYTLQGNNSTSSYLGFSAEL